MLKQRPIIRFIRHLLFWAGVNLFFFIGYFTQPEVYTLDPIPFLVELFFASLLTLLFYTYILIYILLPLLFRGAYNWFAMGLLGLNIVASILYDVLGYLQQFIQHWIGHDPSRLVNSIVFTNPLLGPIFFEINLVAGLMAGIKLFYQWRQKQQESQPLEREKLQNELQLLKLQLNPDFLFGSLDALHTLAEQQTTLAPKVVLKLAHFLRYILYESQTPRVPLAREIGIIDHYIFLQRTSHPTNLEVSLSVRGAINHHSIAPLTLFSIVENAFRQLPTEVATHQSDEQNWVSVDLAVSESLVSLKVVSENICQPHDEDNSLQELARLQKQLTFYYPGRHQLKIWQEDRIKVVTLTIEFPTKSPTSVSEATTDTIA